MIDFSFLSKDASSSEAASYYRWRVFSFVQGDGRHHWRLEPFQMCKNGSVWHPPAYKRRRRSGKQCSQSRSKSSGSQSEESQEFQRLEDEFCLRWKLDRPARALLRKQPRDFREKAISKFNPSENVKNDELSKVFAAWIGRFRKELKEKEEAAAEGAAEGGAVESTGGRAQRSRSRSRQGQAKPSKKVLPGTERLRRRDLKDFEKLLDNLSWQLPDVCRAMVWCLDNANSAIEITKHLLDALTAKDVSMEQRVLRLFLISDVLHNSKSSFSKQASIYRRELEICLPTAFEKLHLVTFGGEDDEADKAKSTSPQILQVLRSWVEYSVFSAQYVKGLEASFLKGIVPANTVVGSKGAVQNGLAVKIAEWRTQHFSQLEKLCKANGMNWDANQMERPCDGKQNIEEAKKSWLLDRLITFEVYAIETRLKSGAPNPSDPELYFSEEEAEVLPGEHDGDALSSGDEDFMRRNPEITVSRRPLTKKRQRTLPPMLADLTLLARQVPGAAAMITGMSAANKISKR